MQSTVYTRWYKHTACRQLDYGVQSVYVWPVQGVKVYAGGKWTTYRRMAEDAVDLACLNGRIPQGLACQTSHLPLVGATGYDTALFTEVAQNYTVPHRPGAIDTRVAKHLAGHPHHQPQPYLQHKHCVFVHSAIAQVQFTGHAFW